VNHALHQVGDHSPRVVDQIPRVPALKPAQVDAKTAQQGHLGDEQPADDGAELALDDSVHMAQRANPKQHAGEPEHAKHGVVVPQRDGRARPQVDEVGQKVGGVG
jgi:hypothetical protein